MNKECPGTAVPDRRGAGIRLDNGILSVGLLRLGATLQELRLAGCSRSLTLGSPDPEAYLPGGSLEYFGAVVGPVANRIFDATTVLDDERLNFAATAAGGHCLHGGDAGLHAKLWEVLSASATEVVLVTTAADGEGGFPGNRRFTARFALAGASLTLSLQTETDAPTLVNLANHSYWNLGPGPDIHDHTLQVLADRVLETDENAMATGRVLPVTGTRFDFRAPRRLGPGDVVDHNFCLADLRGPLRTACVLAGPDGITMTVETTEPGLQVYDARHLPRPGVPGHDGRAYGPRAGLAIEAQVWPDAPNHPDFPSVRLDPGEVRQQVTRFSFARA